MSRLHVADVDRSSCVACLWPTDVNRRRAQCFCSAWVSVEESCSGSSAGLTVDGNVASRAWDPHQGDGVQAGLGGQEESCRQRLELHSRSQQTLSAAQDEAEVKQITQLNQNQETKTCWKWVFPALVCLSLCRKNPSSDLIASQRRFGVIPHLKPPPLCVLQIKSLSALHCRKSLHGWEVTGNQSHRRKRDHGNWNLFQLTLSVTDSRTSSVNAFNRLTWRHQTTWP